MLQLRFFGAPIVARDGRLLHALMHSPALISLLAYLVMYRERPHARPVLATLFWPDMPEARARRNLNNLLWRLRQALAPAEACLLSDGETVQFNPSAPFWLDVAEFETATEALARPEYLPHQHAPALEAAVALYRADFLDGIYDEWTQSQRERLRERYLFALETLIKLYRGSERYADALRIVQQLAQADATYEEAHYQLIQLYDVLGKSQEARAQFQRYETIRREELGLAPSPRMMALERQIGLAATSAASHDVAGELSLLSKVMAVLRARPQAAWPREERASRVALCEHIVDHTSRMGQALKARYASEEAIGYFSLAVEALSQLSDSAEREQRELAIRRECDDLYDWSAERERQAQNLERAEQLAAHMGDLSAQAEVLARRAWMQMRHGQYAAAIGHSQRALRLSAAAGDLRQQAFAHRLLGIAYDEMTDLRAALHHHREALRLDEAAGCLEQIPNDLNNLASIEVTLGDHSAALAKLQRALSSLTPRSSPLTRAMLVGNIGNIWTKLGQFAQAADCLREAMQLARQTGDRETESWLGRCLGRLYHRQGEPERALQMAHHYFKVAQAAEAPRRMAELSDLIALVSLDLADGARALEWAERTAELARAHGFWQYELRSLMRRARAHGLLQQPAEAHALAQRAVALFERRAQPLEEEAELFSICAQSAALSGAERLAEDMRQRARRALWDKAQLIADAELRNGFVRSYPLSSAILKADA